MQLDKTIFPLLSHIDLPLHLRKLNERQLPLLAEELRQFLLQSLNYSGGHFAAGLGAIELTIALHYVFNTPSDRIIWDVGHQTYPHKILTGRKQLIREIRKKGGLAGFPRREESIYDCFGVGHSSTSIGAALGMALASKLLNSDRKHIAVIGDGALTAGMAYEALNHAGDLQANLLVILNDNDMSISENVGGMSNYLARILSSRLYTSMKEGSKKALSAIPPVWKLAKRTEEHVKGMLIPGTLFEEMGFNYLGPIDGHDLPTLLKTLKGIQQLKGPQFLHVATHKGKGYYPAEANPIKYHFVAPGYLDSASTITHSVTSESTLKSKTYSQIFGEWICDMAAKEERLLGITPAMREGSDLVHFSKQYPERYFDVGIAEQHSITLAAGMACEGFKPIVAIYSTFLQRAYDQIIHDVALQNLPVLFAIDRAGLVGADGPTHAGSFDLTYLRCIPNMIIMTPSNENECRQMLYTGFMQNQPCAVRYPRGSGLGVPIESKMSLIDIGKGEVKHYGKDIVIFAFGSMVAPAITAGQRLNATVINMRFVKPLDTGLIREIVKANDLIVTIEENAIMGGAGSAINEFLASQKMQNYILNLGLPDVFIEHGNPQELLADCGLNAEGIYQSIKGFANR